MSKVFLTRETPRQFSYPMSSVFVMPETKGDIGIEIEVEGTSFPHANSELRPYWVYHTDGSLRGEDNAEYVLNKPILFDEVPEALDSLWDIFNKFNSTFDNSPRTSVHVHLNFSSSHINKIAAFAALYFTFEEILTEWCGELRVGNLFCLRGKDAPRIVSFIKQFIQVDGHKDIPDGMHYAGFNIQALRKFGSIEIRTMRGVSDKTTILTWVKILQRLYEIADEVKDPREICDSFSGEGPLGYFSKMLGGYAWAIQNTIGWMDDRIRESLYEGIRMAQDICYCRDWTNIEYVEVRSDPFGRRSKKNTLDGILSAQLQTYGSSIQPGDTVTFSAYATPPPQVHVEETEEFDPEEFPDFPPEYDDEEN